MKKWPKERMLLAGTVLLFLGIAELAARALVPAPLPWKWPQVMYEDSAALGFRLKPLQTSYTADKVVRTNSMGLRAPEMTWSKPPGVRRVLILGDSIAFGYGVRDEDAFPHRLERLLNDGHRPQRYQVINSGVPAFNTGQEVAYLREEGFRLEPDVIVLAVFWNDISDKTGVRVDELGRLIDGDAEPPSGLQRWLASESGYRLRNALKRSRFLYFVMDRFRDLKARVSGKMSPELESQMAVLTGRPNARVNSGWEVVESQLAALKDLCASRGVDLLVALLPMPQLLGPHGFAAPQYPAAVKDMCGEHALTCIDLLPEFERRFTGHTSLFIPYDDHPNERGHEIIAESVLAGLRQAGLLREDDAAPEDARRVSVAARDGVER